jgi:hypothetical protein
MDKKVYMQKVMRINKLAQQVLQLVGQRALLNDKLKDITKQLMEMGLDVKARPENVGLEQWRDTILPFLKDVADNKELQDKFQTLFVSGMETENELFQVASQAESAVNELKVLYKEIYGTHPDDDIQDMLKDPEKG